MLYMQLSAVLVALTFAEGAVLSGPKCEYGEKTLFCQHMKSIYLLNKETLHHMSGRRFDVAKYRLERANQEVRQVLRKKEKEVLLELSSRALDLESSSLFETLSRCSKELTKTPCYTIIRGLFYATTDLVEAMLEIIDGKQKEAVQKLYNAFKNEGKPTGKVYKLAREVLAALE